jgi:hypothetical protein
VDREGGDQCNGMRGVAQGGNGAWGVGACAGFPLQGWSVLEMKGKKERVWGADRLKVVEGV